MRRFFRGIWSWLLLVGAWLIEGFLPTPDECRERGFAYALNQLGEGATFAELEAESDGAANRSESERQFDFGVREGIQYWKNDPHGTLQKPGMARQS